MPDRKILQVSTEAHAALKAESERTGQSMYQIASHALSGACGDDLERVGELLRQLGSDTSPGARLDVLAYVMGEHGQG